MGNHNLEISTAHKNQVSWTSLFTGAQSKQIR